MNFVGKEGAALGYEFMNAAIMPIIHGSAGASLILFLVTYFYSKTIDRDNPGESRKAYICCEITYTVFVVLISIFPLLGMLGTVCSLLSLDMTGDTALLQNNFFQALITTFWGIIYAIIFKIVNAIFQTQIEARLAVGKRLVEDSVEVKAPPKPPAKNEGKR